MILEEIEKVIFGEPAKMMRKELKPLKMTDEQIEFFLLGSEASSFEALREEMDAEEDDLITGLMQVCKIKLGKYSLYKSKRSSELAIRIISRMLTDPEYELKSNMQQVMSNISIEQLKMLDLGKHHYNWHEGRNRLNAKDSFSLKIARYVHEVLNEHPLSDYVKKKKYEELILRDLEEHPELEERGSQGDGPEDKNERPTASEFSS